MVFMRAAENARAPPVLKAIVLLSLASLTSRNAISQITFFARRPVCRQAVPPAAAASNSQARIVFLGSPACVEVVLRKLWAASSQNSPGSSFELCAVVSQPPKRVGDRRQPPSKTPVHKLSEELGIACLTPETARDDAFLAELEALRPDVCITAAYGQYLPRRFLETPRLGTLNLHPSLLPRWRGASPVQRALQAGDTETGITILYTVAKMDAGPIVSQERMQLSGSETSLELLNHLFEWGSNLLVEEALPKVLDGSVTLETALQQDEGLVTKAPLIMKDEGKLWPHNETALQMRDKIRGFDGWPGTTIPLACSGSTAAVQGLRVRVAAAEVVSASDLPGPIPEGAIQEELFFVPACDGREAAVGLRPAKDASNILLLRRFHVPSKKEVPAETFQKGYMLEQPARWLWPEDEARLIAPAGTSPKKAKKMRRR